MGNALALVFIGIVSAAIMGRLGYKIARDQHYSGAAGATIGVIIPVFGILWLLFRNHQSNKL